MKTEIAVTYLPRSSKKKTRHCFLHVLMTKYRRRDLGANVLVHIITISKFFEFFLLKAIL